MRSLTLFLALLSCSLVWADGKVDGTDHTGSQATTGRDDSAVQDRLRAIANYYERAGKLSSAQYYRGKLLSLEKAPLRDTVHRVASAEKARLRATAEYYERAGKLSTAQYYRGKLAVLDR